MEYLLVKVRPPGGGAKDGGVNIELPFFVPSLHDFEQTDLDASYIFSMERDQARGVELALRQAFNEYDWINQYRKRRNKPLRVGLGRFVCTDETGYSIARRIVDFLIENRVSLGDEGTWQMRTLREFILNREGINLAEIEHKKCQLLLPRKNRFDADYADELVSFRFPSTTCLYGVSQALADLRGAVQFRRLFIRDGSGVYVAFDEEEVLYVGMSESVRNFVCEAYHVTKEHECRSRHASPKQHRSCPLSPKNSLTSLSMAP